MTRLTFHNLKPLVNSMKSFNADKERFSFVFNHLTFDCIFSFTNAGYEILVGVHQKNFAILLNCNSNFVVELTDENYFKLSQILNLTYHGNNFSSIVFLRLLSSKIKPDFSGYKCTYSDLFPFLKCRLVYEQDKIYFKGWNDHQKDGRKARNFDKTEFFLGKNVSDYCRKNNISSLWTDMPNEKVSVTKPWE